MANANADIGSIVERCQAGEEKAFSELFQAISTDLHRIVLGTIGPDQELEDIMQTAALEVFRSIKNFKGKSKFSTWLYRLVVNVTLQHLRRRKNVLPPIDVGELADSFESNESTPEQNSLNIERVRLMREILNEIAPKKRMVFIMHDIEEMSPSEISENIGVSVLTVKSRLFYARKDFFKKLRQKAMLAEVNKN